MRPFEELIQQLKDAATKDALEKVCRHIVELQHAGRLIGPCWLLEDAFFNCAGKFYTAMTAAELSKEIQRQIDTNILAPARSIYPEGNIQYSLSYDLDWTYSMCFLHHMKDLCQNMEHFIINYCNEDNDFTFRIIPLHVAKFLRSVSAFNYYGLDDDFNITAWECKGFKSRRGKDIYIYIPDPAEHSRHVVATTMERMTEELRKRSYTSTVSILKGDNPFNTVTVYKSALATNIDSIYGLLAAKYPNATYMLLSHSEHRELPDICKDIWNNRFKRTVIPQHIGFRLTVIEYAPTNVVAYIVLPERD